MRTRSPRPVQILAVALLTAAPVFVLAQSESYTLEPAPEGRQWQASPADLSRDPEIDAARRLLAEDRPKKAKVALDRYIEANDTPSNPFMAEALLLRADALVARGYEFKALYDYERLIREHPQSEHFLTAIEREHEIGMQYLGGLKKRVLGVRFANGTEIGIELLIRVQERAPGTVLAERSAIALADYYFAQREMALARDAYDLYVLNHPNGPNRPRAEERLIYADVARFKGPKYDASGLLDARVRTQTFALHYPERAERSGINEGLVARIDESLAAQLLDSARWYETQDELTAMRYTLERLVRGHPRTGAAARSLVILEDRGWLADLDRTDDMGPDEPVLFEGPGSGQVEATAPPVRDPLPAPEPPMDDSFQDERLPETRPEIPPDEGGRR